MKLVKDIKQNNRDDGCGRRAELPITPRSSSPTALSTTMATTSTTSTSAFVPLCGFSTNFAVLARRETKPLSPKSPYPVGARGLAVLLFRLAMSYVAGHLIRRAAKHVAKFGESFINRHKINLCIYLTMT